MAESSVEELQRVNPDGKDTHIASEEVNEHTEYHSSSQQQNKPLGQNYCRSMVGQTFEQESSEHIAEPRRVEAEKERFQAYFGNSYTAMTYTEASAAQSKLNNRGSNQQEKSQTSKRIKESGGLEGVSYVEKTLPNPQSTDVNNKRMPKGQYGDVNSGDLSIKDKVLHSSLFEQPPPTNNDQTLNLDNNGRAVTMMQPYSSQASLHSLTPSNTLQIATPKKSLFRKTNRITPSTNQLQFLRVSTIDHETSIPNTAMTGVSHLMKSKTAVTEKPHTDNFDPNDCGNISQSPRRIKLPNKTVSGKKGCCANLNSNCTLI